MAAMERYGNGALWQWSAMAVERYGNGALCMSDAADVPVFHVEPRGGFASRMFQYMVALKFITLAPGCRIANVMLAEWGIAHPPVASPGPVADADALSENDLADLAEKARNGALRRIVYSGIDLHMANFMPAQACRNMFQSPATPPFRFGDGHLVCPLGSEAAAEETGPFHPLTPVAFFREIIDETGLKPVFVGQAVPRPYLELLHAQFPQAEFDASGDPFMDFLAIRQARNIVVGVNSFAWLAAWLSQAERIFMTVSGWFNPMQHQFVDLLPFGDPRYLFHLFPINYAVPLEHLAAAHRRIAPFWRPVSHEALQRRIKEAGRLDPTHPEILDNFDPDFYLSSNPRLLELLGAGNVEGARQHYLLLGVRGHFLPFRLTPEWYAARYPMAAFEVGQGDYANFAHHYIGVGRDRGYRPVPEPNEPWWD